MVEAVAVADYQQCYPDPIRVDAGERLIVTQREDLWDGHRWVWAVDPDSREGWVPDNLPVLQGQQFVAAYAYNAIELNARVGEKFQCAKSTHGWIWCVNQNGDQGWLPRAIFAR